MKLWSPRLPLFTAEGYACPHVVLLGVQEGFSSVLIEGDSKSVVKKCESDLPNKSEIGAIIFSIQNLKKSFHNISFIHVARSGNSVAHDLQLFR